ncbi:hypothetical protein OS493_001708 [Desmophyllum pertusum]|uniref:Protein kinase domain-containing protein n=1 Tax=Desmophyllum pertusum TaxID=174260 RepID=A0A9X0CTH7_9CNID|nr:hypothetical protein OS493_001708 [Desmophyllum pertusum]
MYGIVVGRLPFRSPHYGSRGRNELVDQTSRGLSCTHNKYLVLLTPHCRDLLRKLLEPNPQMRLPLLDVMVHPWVTVQGTAPLVPYTERPIDEQLQDKVLGRTSQLIKIDKSKIAFHVQQKRFDAISGVYNLLLDEEFKSASTSNNSDRGIQTTGDQEASVIRVSIKPVTSDHGKENGDQVSQGAQGAESESATSFEGQDLQAEHDWEQAPTRKHMVHKPK